MFCPSSLPNTTKAKDRVTPSVKELFDSSTLPTTKSPNPSPLISPKPATSIPKPSNGFIGGAAIGNGFDELKITMPSSGLPASTALSSMALVSVRPKTT